MDLDEPRSDPFREPSANPGIPVPDAGNAALERDCGRGHLAKGRTDFLHARKRHYLEPGYKRLSVNPPLRKSSDAAMPLAACVHFGTRSTPGRANPTAAALQSGNRAELRRASDTATYNPSLTTLPIPRRRLRHASRKLK